MTQWEYVHVRATVGIRDFDPFSFPSTQSKSAVFLVNGKEYDIEVDDAYRVDIQNSVVQLLNDLGTEGWELVSHSDRVRESGTLLPGPTEYTFFLKRPRVGDISV